MNKWLIVLMAGILAFAVNPAVEAGTADLTITANVPPANDVGFFVSTVTGTAPDYAFSDPVLGSQTLDFGTLAFDSATGAFLADHFYAVDVGAISTLSTPPVPAAGQVGTVQVSFTEGLTRSIGKKAISTFVKVTGAPGSQTETTFDRHTLSASNLDVTPSQFADGFLRIYLGIYTGEVFSDFPVESDGEPFTTADEAGDYTGTLTLTATLQ